MYNGKKSNIFHKDDLNEQLQNNEIELSDNQESRKQVDKHLIEFKSSLKI